MADWLHIYEGEDERFWSEAEAYEFLGRKLALLLAFSEFSELLVRVPPSVTCKEPDQDGRKYAAAFRVSIRKHG